MMLRNMGCLRKRNFRIFRNRLVLLIDLVRRWGCLMRVSMFQRFKDFYILLSSFTSLTRNYDLN